MDALRAQRLPSDRDAAHPPRARVALDAFDPIEVLLPRVLAARYGSVRRDVDMVVGRLRGRRPALFRSRGPLATEPSASPSPVRREDASALAVRRMRIDQLVRETPDALTLVLTDPSGAPVAFVPGQFLTVQLVLDGERVRRAYSISSCALETARVSITVKRVPGGRVSNYLNDRVREGDELEVLGPSGVFTLRPDPAARRHLVLVGGGSGITPLMSIARTALAVEPDTRVALVYGNRSLADVIFREAIDALVIAHPQRFEVRHVLSSPPEGWKGGMGVLDGPMLLAQLASLATPPGPEADYYVCGPEPMMAAVRSALRESLGVAAAHIHEERFSNPAGRKRPATAEGSVHVVSVYARGAAREVSVGPGRTILEACVAAGIELPYSCAMGGCGACKVRLISGEVTMEEPNCLSPDERAQGLVLACIAHPRSPASVEAV